MGWEDGKWTPPTKEEREERGLSPEPAGRGRTVEEAKVQEAERREAISKALETQQPKEAGVVEVGGRKISVDVPTPEGRAERMAIATQALALRRSGETDAEYLQRMARERGIPAKDPTVEPKPLEYGTYVAPEQREKWARGREVVGMKYELETGKAEPVYAFEQKDVFYRSPSERFEAFLLAPTERKKEMVIEKGVKLGERYALPAMMATATILSGGSAGIAIGGMAGMVVGGEGMGLIAEREISQVEMEAERRKGEVISKAITKERDVGRFELFKTEYGYRLRQPATYYRLAGEVAGMVVGGGIGYQAEKILTKPKITVVRPSQFDVREIGVKKADRTRVTEQLGKYKQLVKVETPLGKKTIYGVKGDIKGLVVKKPDEISTLISKGKLKIFEIEKLTRVQKVSAEQIVRSTQLTTFQKQTALDRLKVGLQPSKQMFYPRKVGTAEVESLALLMKEGEFTALTRVTTKYQRQRIFKKKTITEFRREDIITAGKVTRRQPSVAYEGADDLQYFDISYQVKGYGPKISRKPVPMKDVGVFAFERKFTPERIGKMDVIAQPIGDIPVVTYRGGRITEFASKTGYRFVGTGEEILFTDLTKGIAKVPTRLTMQRQMRGFLTKFKPKPKVPVEKPFTWMKTEQITAQVTKRVPKPLVLMKTTMTKEVAEASVRGVVTHAPTVRMFPPIVKPDVDLDILFRERVDYREKMGGRFVEDVSEKEALAPLQVMQQMQIQVVSQRQRQAQVQVPVQSQIEKQIERERAVVGVPTVTTPPTTLRPPIFPMIPPVFIPLPPLPLGFVSGKKRRIAVRAKYGYTPSYRALVFKIRGPKAKPAYAGRYTGFQLRKIPKGFRWGSIFSKPKRIVAITKRKSRRKKR